MTELKQVKAGLCRIIFAAACFILLFMLQCFTDFSKEKKLLYERISDNTRITRLEEMLSETVFGKLPFLS